MAASDYPLERTSGAQSKSQRSASFAADKLTFTPFFSSNTLEPGKSTLEDSGNKPSILLEPRNGNSHEDECQDYLVDLVCRHLHE